MFSVAFSLSYQCEDWSNGAALNFSVLGSSVNFLDLLYILVNSTENTDLGGITLLDTEMTLLHHFQRQVANDCPVIPHSGKQHL